MANYNDLLPEQLARIKIDKQLMETGWEVVSRGGIIKFTTINLLSLTKLLSHRLHYQKLVMRYDS